MGASVLVETYRTAEIPELYQYKSVCTLTYFDNKVFITGLSGTFDTQCWKEIRSYLLTKDVSEVHFVRKGKLKTIKLK